MDTRTLRLTGAPMPPFEDGVEASSVAERQPYPGVSTTVHGVLLAGNAVNASRCDILSPRTHATSEPPRDAVQASLAVDLAAVSAAITAYSAGVNPGYASASPDIVTELMRTITQMTQQLDRLASLSSCFRPATLPHPVHSELPEFSGSQDDADAWVETVNALGSRRAWPDDHKRLVAIDRLRGAAKAWHNYDGIKRQSWPEWCAALIAAFGPISYDATNEANTSGTEDEAREGHLLEAETAHCRSPADSVAAGPSLSSGPRSCSPLHVSYSAHVSDTTPLLPVAESYSHLQKSAALSSRTSSRKDMKRPVSFPPSIQVTDQPKYCDNWMNSTPLSAADSTFHPPNSQLPPPKSALLQHTEAMAPLASDAPYRDADVPTDIRNERLREPFIQHPRLSAQAWEAQGGGHSKLSKLSVNEPQMKEHIIPTNDLPIPPAPPPYDIASDSRRVLTGVNEAMTTNTAEVIFSRELAMQPKYLSSDTASDPFGMKYSA